MQYVSGEDPFVGFTMVQPVVRGIQSTGTMANAKHFIDNNQEASRGNVSAVVDERTQHQLYLAPFEGAVKAGVRTIMCSYQRINGVYSCESEATLGYLKSPTGLNFSGFVMSDWGGTRAPTSRPIRAHSPAS